MTGGEHRPPPLAFKFFKFEIVTGGIFGLRLYRVGPVF